MSKYIHITRLDLITQLQYKSFFVATLIRTFIQVYYLCKSTGKSK